MKQCTKCGQTKDISHFHKSRNSKDGFRYTCNECENEYMKNYYNQKPQGRFVRLKRNALKDGASIEITKDEFVQWFNTQELKCFYCETQLEFVYGRHWQWNGLTIDRLIPDAPYKFDNIALACRRCNMIKGNWFTKEQMLEIAIKYLRG